MRECGEHGYFRDEECSICGERGRFLMSEEETDALGRTLAGILRHFPEKYDLVMDEQAWVNLNDLVGKLRWQRRFRWLKPLHIMSLIETDPKGRYQVRDDKIRATYAHTVNVDPDLPTLNIPDELYYPTNEDELEALLETGLMPVDRRKVHLSKTYASAMNAGRVRDLFPKVVKIDAKTMIADGNVIKKAGTTVFVAEEVQAQYLSPVVEEMDDPEGEAIAEKQAEQSPDDVAKPQQADAGAPEPEVEQDVQEPTSTVENDAEESKPEE